MPDVEISYKGSQIASMNATGVKTLLTSAMFCEDDIIVSYTRPTETDGDNLAYGGNTSNYVNVGQADYMVI